MRALVATSQGALAEVRANRGAFWTSLLAMVGNDLAWVAFWLLFFDRVGTVRGWDASRVLVFEAVLTASGGIVLGLLANARRIGRLAAEGELDAVLALPVPPLAHLLVRRIDPANLGDVAFGLVLFLVAGEPTLARTAVYLGCVVAAAVLFVGFLVATGSLAFFVGEGETGEFGFNAMILLSSYPADVFTGATKALVYTAIPAAFVATVPSSLVDSFDVRSAAALGAAAVLSAGAGWVLFTLGLRRYTSGSLWTRA